MKKLLALILITAASLGLSSCAGVLDKATLAYGKASDKFQDGTGITLGQGFSILTGAYRSYATLKDANRLTIDNAGSPLPPWPSPTPSAKSVQPDPQPAPVQAQPANWWNTIF